jgi:hypothetical protein
MILETLPATQEMGSDLRLCGAPLRNRTVDLLLTMNPCQVPLLQVEDTDQEKHEPTPALTSSDQGHGSTRTTEVVYHRELTTHSFTDIDDPL